MSQLTEEEKLECLKEAVASHGNTDRTRKWYKKWKPKYYVEYGIPTTTQYSLSCVLMRHAFELCYADPENLGGRDAIRDFKMEETNFVGINRGTYDKFVENHTDVRFNEEDGRKYKREGFYPFKLKPSDLGENDFGTKDVEDCFNNLGLLNGKVYALLNFEDRTVAGPIHLKGVSENDAKEFKNIVENQGGDIDFRGRLDYPRQIGGKGTGFILEVK